MALPPKKLKIYGMEVICPIDPSSKGTWIATSKNYTLVLLNGGFKAHETKPSFRQSRGRIIMDFMQWNNPKLFFENFGFEDMEPFTLVIFNNDNRTEILEIRWCTGQKYLKKLNGEEALIWSSATLYDPLAIENRKSWFLEHLEKSKRNISSENMLDFHLNGGNNDQRNSIKLKRSEGIETVCITQLEIQKHSKCLYFNNLTNNTSKRFIIY
jgi:hypothetical protein